MAASGPDTTSGRRRRRAAFPGHRPVLLLAADSHVLASVLLGAANLIQALVVRAVLAQIDEGSVLGRPRRAVDTTRDMRALAIAASAAAPAGAPIGTMAAWAATHRSAGRMNPLITNAVKFVAPGVRPHIMIKSQVTDGMREIQVSDKGVGIPDWYRGSVFDSFFRSSETGELPGSRPRHLPAGRRTSRSTHRRPGGT